MSELQYTITPDLLTVAMPHATVPEYQHIQVTELAPTFGAEVSGIDFTKPVPPEVFQEISDASAQVCFLLLRHSYS